MQVYLTDEAAKILKVTPRTVLKLARTGRLPGSKIGRHWRFTEQDLTRFLETSRPASPTPTSTTETTP
jgi:excisionase family DNA binding protein